MKLMKDFELWYLTEIEDETEEQMIQLFASSLVTEIQAFCGKPFALTIAEQNETTNKVTWSAKIAMVNEEGNSIMELPGARQKFTTSGVQKYLAKYPVVSGQDYSGSVSIEVEMWGVFYDVAPNGKFTIVTLPRAEADVTAKTLIRLALVHYYEAIKVFYPEWLTYYVDAPKYHVQPIKRT